MKIQAAGNPDSDNLLPLFNHICVKDNNWIIIPFTANIYANICGRINLQINRESNRINIMNVIIDGNITLDYYVDFR